MVPAGVNGADVIDVAYRRYNLALGAGLSKVAGKLFRIGHLGDLNELMLLGAIAGAEMAMRDTGIEVDSEVASRRRKRISATARRRRSSKSQPNRLSRARGDSGASGPISPTSFRLSVLSRG